MVWQAEWKAISNQVIALRTIDEHLNVAVQRSNSHHHYIIERFAGQVYETKRNLKTFYNTYASALPSDAQAVIQNYFGVGDGHEFTSNVGNTPQLIAASLLLLDIFLLVTQVDYLLTNTSEIVKRQSERAFLHLQQSIAAANDIQIRWQKAFDETRGEEACEKLGAAHLLQHGIYAFKANAEGARTDLVFSERTLNIADVERTAEGLVLTEWKKVNTQEEKGKKQKEANAKEANTKAAQARKQAALYRSGILGGIELVNYRYIVLVSAHQLAPLTDMKENGVFYRHINIAVGPRSPSEESVTHPQQIQPS